MAASVGFALATGLLPWSAPEEALPTDPFNVVDDDDGGGEASDDGGSGDAAPPPDPPEGPFDVTLSVRADAGPLGPEPLPVRDRPIGTNVWFHHGWWPEVDEEWATLLAGMEPGFLRWPSGHPSQQYCFEAAGYPPAEECDARYTVSGQELEAFVALSRSVGAEPLVGVNVKEGTPAMAADMVRYANVDNDLDVTWWYLGNEPDIGGDAWRLPIYAEDYAAFEAAMREVDPDVKLVGPEVMTGANVLGIHDRIDWVRPFLEANPGTVDAISWHIYPLDSENGNPHSPAHATRQNLLQWDAPGWRPSGLKFIAEAQGKLRADRDELMPGAEIWITELGPDSGAPGAPGITDGHVAAVWFADVVGRLLAEDADVILQFAFDHWVEGVDELSLIRDHPEGNGFATLPPYDALHLVATTLGDEIVHASSSNESHIGVHASRHADGSVTVMMVNKGDEPVRARLTVAGTDAPFARADAWVLAGEDPTSLTDTRINGERVTAAVIEAGGVEPVDVPADADAARELPPLSVTVITFTPEAE